VIILERRPSAFLGLCCWRCIRSGRFFWFEQTSVSIIHPGPKHGAIMRGLWEPLGTGGNLTSDAHLAALALEHRAELCSADHDFQRFPGLKWRNPLA
jgi:uncharacterized protein